MPFSFWCQHVGHEKHKLLRTQASRQLLAPLGAHGPSVEAGEQTVSGQSESFVTDVLDG